MTSRLYEIKQKRDNNINGFVTSALLQLCFIQLLLHFLSFQIQITQLLPSDFDDPLQPAVLSVLAEVL